MSRKLTEKERQILVKHMKRCPTSVTEKCKLIFHWDNIFHSMKNEWNSFCLSEIQDWKCILALARPLIIGVLIMIDDSGYCRAFPMEGYFCIFTNYKWIVFNLYKNPTPENLSCRCNCTCAKYCMYKLVPCCIGGHISKRLESDQIFVYKRLCLAGLPWWLRW